MLNAELAAYILNEAAPSAFYLNLYFQGEPYLHPDFLAIVAKARALRYYVATSTNGHYLTPAVAEKTINSGLSRLIISLDGTTQDTYQAYRVGGSLAKVLTGIQNLVEMRAKARQLRKDPYFGPYLIIQFLVVGPNEHQMEEARTLASSLGVDSISFKTAQIYDYQNGSPLIPINKAFSRYKPLGNGKFELAYPISNQCWRMWHSFVATWDGRLVPCCFDKDAQYQMGILGPEGTPLKKIWRNSAYKSFRASLLTSRNTIDICTNCTEGCKVRILD
jgi:radical SAM protein with 4Fe4S-binding SPASM domain